jgi:hypothetical protein
VLAERALDFDGFKALAAVEAIQNAVDYLRCHVIIKYIY